MWSKTSSLTNYQVLKIVLSMFVIEQFKTYFIMFRVLLLGSHSHLLNSLVPKQLDLLEWRGVYAVTFSLFYRTSTGVQIIKLLCLFVFNESYLIFVNLSLFPVLRSCWDLNLRSFSFHAYLIRRLPNFFHGLFYEVPLCFMNENTSCYSYANTGNKRQLQEGQNPLFWGSQHVTSGVHCQPVHLWM